MPRTETGRRRSFTLAAIVASVAAHGLLFAILAWFHPALRPEPPRPVEVTLVTMPAPPQPAAPAAAPPQEPKPVPQPPPVQPVTEQPSAELPHETPRRVQRTAVQPHEPHPAKPHRKPAKPTTPSLATAPAPEPAHQVAVVAPSPPAPPAQATPAATGVSARPISGSEPPYPESMLDSGREGSVDLDCTIGTDGRAQDCALVAVHGGYAFGSAAQDWIGQVRYSPATIGGKPVETPHHRIHIVFRMQ